MLHVLAAYKSAFVSGQELLHACVSLCLHTHCRGTAATSLNTAKQEFLIHCMCLLQKKTVFTTASQAQARDFLLRMDEPHLSQIGQQSKLQIPDLGSVGGKAAKVEAILSAAEGQGGPYKLLAALGEMYTRVFLVEHWEQIAELFGPQDFGYNNDHMGYDKNTCQLFILWAWAHM